MNLHMKLIHRLLCYFHENPNKNYFGIIDDMEIVNLLIDMKFIEVFIHTYLVDEKNFTGIFIKVTPKGLMFINSYAFIF
ncbi:hypothetical protein QNJ28_08835 [Macrococcus caseolyticus]|uniref:hypothetical protein n=1 Tax=Macrococcoides caseolyticum TaxID=69966 RepID=UPI0024BD517D|nr:hypothetical protein [Macrococcus caseolyticus]MDJ1110191.1 hypothetical protein [Macrococcus caseolyticus]